MEGGNYTRSQFKFGNISILSLEMIYLFAQSQANNNYEVNARLCYSDPHYRH